MLPEIPQKNSMLEQVFATIYFHMCIMVMHVGINENLKTGIFPKWVATTAKFENIMVNPHREKCAYEKFWGKMLDYTKHLNNFG